MDYNKFDYVQSLNNLRTTSLLILTLPLNVLLLVNVVNNLNNPTSL
jgi:hypothetical protein